MTDTPWDRLRSDAASYPMMYGTGVDDRQIEKAETILGCRFDSAYVQFLREFGGAMLGPEPLLGLQQAEVMGVDSWSVIEVTKRFRTDGWAGVDDWYVVSVDGSGNPVGVGRDGAVYISDHHGAGIVRLATSFSEYLSGRV
jgi:hypothetical protein